MEMLETLEPILKTFWYIAIPTTVIFLIQTVMSFVGADSSDGLDVDFDGDLGQTEAPFQLFSLRNLINFLLGFSWTGISFYNIIENKTLLIIAALAVGLAFLFLFFAIIKQIQKLAEDNSFKLSKTINKSAEVYLTIPKNKSGFGKIIISVNGSVHELQAMTEGDEIPSASLVVVKQIENGDILIVEKI